MTTTTSLKALAAAAGIAMGGALALPVAAQTAEPVQPAVPATEFSDSEIEAFAIAAIDVAQIRDRFAAELADVTDEAQQQQLVEEGNAAMLTAVEESPGITLEQYLMIGEAAMVDPELSARVNAVIEAQIAE